MMRFQGSLGYFRPFLFATALVTWAASAVAQEPKGPIGHPFVTSARPSTWVRTVQSADPDCFCWAHGRKYGAGQRTCLRTVQGMRMALCDRVINLMSWTPSDEPCGES